MTEPCEYPLGTPKAALDTPALVVDLDVLAANIARIISVCQANAVTWRPHVKSLKSPQLAAELIAAGASGVACATLGEAMTMARAGIDNILIANQIVGATKLVRLVELCRTSEIIVTVDSATGVAELAAAATAADVVPGVVIEVDIGLHRAGVQPGPAVATLAQIIASQPSLHFRGLMAWEGHTTKIADPAAKACAISAAIGQLVASAEHCRQAGLQVDIVSCGGTGTYQFTACEPGITEIQAGGGVFSDVRYREQFGLDHPFALSVMATVISRPNPQRVVCDAGRKSMSCDYAIPRPIGLDAVRSVVLSAEHATVELTQANSALAVGDLLEFVVGYADTTVYLHDQIYGVRGGLLETTFRLPVRRRP